MTGEPQTLAGRRAAVTGGAQGIGLAIAESLARAGATVAVLDQDAGAAAAAAGRLAGDARAFDVDVRSPDRATAAFRAVADALGGLDILVNNAGVRITSPFATHSLEAWQTTLDVDLTGVMICSQAALVLLEASPAASVINIASITGSSAFRNRPAYAAAKAGVLGLTRAMALELGPKGIRCNAVSPGVIETPLTADFLSAPELQQRLTEAIPLGRVGRVEDVAAVVAFLASDAARYVTGIDLRVDGGFTAGRTIWGEL